MTNCFVHKTSWELVLPRSGTSVTKSHVHDSGTSVTKAHVQHPWTRYAQTWTWGENDLFHVIFSDTTSTRQIFCFSIFDRKYHKGIPPIYIFLLYPHYFSSYESKKNKNKRILKWEAGELNKYQKPISAPRILFVSLAFQIPIGKI